MKALQIFTPEYLQESRKMTSEQVMEFLESFRKLAAVPGTKVSSRLISLRVEAPLLAAFQQKARLHGVRYQTKIKELMREYAKGGQ